MHFEEDILKIIKNSQSHQSQNQNKTGKLINHPATSG